MECVFGSTFVCKTIDAARAVAFNREIGTPSVTLDGDIFQPSGLLTGGSRKCAETYDILPDGFKLKKEDGVYYMSYAMGRGCLTFGEMMQKISDLKDGSTMVFSNLNHRSNSSHFMKEQQRKTLNDCPNTNFGGLVTLRNKMRRF
ncbi:uncharacterized protein LOC114287397 isoform X2 [Camellia sinensis]|uniref:uncharacterized protein LOC114287397 isoform X2 n=1 Tax=Camellia sinensis TaxID=4442 RepID=UPI00103557D5|nr:uncharacterized protein LOC114287397 isoform X2 [Camellia sinensis]